MIPARTCSSVLLPAPFGPITPSDSPRTRVNDTLRNAQKGSSGSRENICTNDSRSVVFFVKRRLYCTPRSTASIAWAPDARMGGGWTAALKGPSRTSVRGA